MSPVKNSCYFHSFLLFFTSLDFQILTSPLVFQVAIEEMVQRVTMLDPYSRPLLAPRGIVFPFPMFCSKLDSYMKRENELSAHFTQNGGVYTVHTICYLAQTVRSFLYLALYVHLSLQPFAFNLATNSHLIPLSYLAVFLGNFCVVFISYNF